MWSLDFGRTLELEFYSRSVTKVKLNKRLASGDTCSKWQLQRWSPGLSPADPVLFLFDPQCHLKSAPLSCAELFIYIGFYIFLLVPWGQRFVRPNFRRSTVWAPRTPLRAAVLSLLLLSLKAEHVSLQNQIAGVSLLIYGFQKFRVFFFFPCCPECCLKSHNGLNNWWLLYEIVSRDPSSRLPQPQVLE